MDPPVNAADPPRKGRLSPERRADRNREIARAHLVGRSWREICEEWGVSRNTARQAARDYADSVREPEPIVTLDDLDVDHLIALSLRTVGEGLQECRRIIADGATATVKIAATNAAGRAASALTWTLIRTGYLADPADLALARRAEQFEAVWGRALGKAYADLPEEQFERMLDEITTDARIQGGLALATYTSNGREP